jgi:hypothetical protein
VDIANPDTQALTGILAHHLGGDLGRIIAGRSTPPIIATTTKAPILPGTGVTSPNQSGAPDMFKKNSNAGDRL